MLRLTRYWYRPTLHPILFPLLPLAGLFGLVTSVRRWLYQQHIFAKQSLPVSVIVVGNIVVGGTGKTPMVIWLAEWLRAQGFTPGIISRGVGGKKHRQPHLVNLNDDVTFVGDEALLLARRTKCPVMLCVNRVLAAQSLLQQKNCDIILSDDGLQHYRLARDIEIVMIDSMREFGNAFLLPAGPLRELPGRLRHADFVLRNNLTFAKDDAMTLTPTQMIAVNNPQQKISLQDFPRRVHAVSGIGHPEKFFAMLQQLGFEITPHVFPDHYHYAQHELQFNDELPILMTEKDAVKCLSFANDKHWYLEVNAQLSQAFQQKLLARIHGEK